MNPRTLATILAALRYWQREGQMSSGHEHDIASDGDTLIPLTAEEIDELYESLNLDDTRWIPATADSLPDEEVSVIVHTSEGVSAEAYLESGQWFWPGIVRPISEGLVTYWREFPPPPDEPTGPITTTDTV